MTTRPEAPKKSGEATASRHDLQAACIHTGQRHAGHEAEDHGEPHGVVVDGQQAEIGARTGDRSSGEQPPALDDIGEIRESDREGPDDEPDLNPAGQPGDLADGRRPLETECGATADAKNHNESASNSASATQLGARRLLSASSNAYTPRVPSARAVRGRTTR
jgi:hypothetical protein